MLRVFKGQHGSLSGLESHTHSQRCTQLRDDARDVVLFVNRAAGTGRRQRRIDDVVRCLAESDFRPTVVNSVEQLKLGVDQMKSSETLRAVLACGGDGTLAAVVNAAPAGIPLAIVPMGTENLMARYLRHSLKPKRVASLLKDGVVVNLDAGRIGSRLFTLVVSAGFDARVIHDVHARRTGGISRWAYALPILRAMIGYQFPKVRAIATGPDGRHMESEGRWAFAANLPQYAQQIRIVNQAVGTDGLLDLCVFRKGSVASGFWYFWHVLRQRHHRLPSVTTALFTHLRIESVDGREIPYQIDGDPGGMLPVEVDAVPGRLSFVVMPKTARRLGVALPSEPLAAVS